MSSAFKFIFIFLFVACVPVQTHDVEPAKLETVVANPVEFNILRVFNLTVENTEEYPRLYAAFQEAIAAWTVEVPIVANVNVVPEMFAKMVPPGITVRFQDLQAGPYYFPEGVLGVFSPYNRMLLVDADLEANLNGLPLIVTIHEIGHALGLPHIVGEDSPLRTYSDENIMIKRDDAAREQVMYPFVGNELKILQELEIELVRRRLANGIGGALTKETVCYGH